mmetsp:Transcript_4144/g.9083  ORF Transcript_4144/g.9083 Transcript_4144/m.9083 type:complete len:424 (-) Transcript_4144:375-1646(-)
MGAAASAFSKEQSAAITKALELKYAELSAKPDAELQAAMTAEYNRLVVSFHMPTSPTRDLKTSASSPNLPSPSKGLGRGLSRPNGLLVGALTGGGTSVKKTGGSRRKSFDAKTSPKLNKAALAAQEALDEISKSEAEAAAAAATAAVDNVDSWDSVTAQPYCELCQMAFKTIVFLTRHEKYSDLHTKNVAKLELADAVLEPVVSNFVIGADGVFPSESVKLTNKQEEGKHYKLLYSGSKLFWRTQDTVDLNVYHHLLPATVEVIAYDPTRGRELNRLYLSYSQLSALAALTTGTDDQTAMIRYIIQRLQLSTATAKRLNFVQLPSDLDDTSPTLDTPPIVLIPISVPRRRRTNAEEIEQTMAHLEIDSAALKEATQHAHSVFIMHMSLLLTYTPLLTPYLSPLTFIYPLHSNLYNHYSLYNTV